MKKVVLAVIAALLASVLCFAIVGCASPENVKVIDVKLTDESYAYAVKEGNKELLDKVNEFMGKLKSSEGIDGVTLDSIVEKEGNWKIGRIGSVQTVSKDRSKELVVSTMLELLPFEYMDGSKLAGYDMHVAKMWRNTWAKRLSF